MIFTNIFNSDFQDLLKAFNDEKLEYLLVGGYSVILHGYNRTTGDLDLWVNPTKQNHEKLRNAFGVFGLPTEAILLKDFLNTDKFDVYTFGVPPVSIDILTKVKGLKFEDAFTNVNFFEIENQVKIPVLHKNDLIKAKKAAGRNKDLDDIENLL